MARLIEVKSNMNDKLYINIDEYNFILIDESKKFIYFSKANNPKDIVKSGFHILGSECSNYDEIYNYITKNNVLNLGVEK